MKTEEKKQPVKKPAVKETVQIQPPKRESSGDNEFDAAILKMLKFKV